MKGLGLLTFIRMQFSKSVCFLTLGYFEMSSLENSPEPGTSSGAHALAYSEVVQGISAPLYNDFWYRYQKQDSYFIFNFIIYFLFCLYLYFIFLFLLYFIF